MDTIIYTATATATATLLHGSAEPARQHSEQKLGAGPDARSVQT